MAGIGLNPLGGLADSRRLFVKGRRWKRRVHRIVVPGASTMSPRIGTISAVSWGFARTSNAVVSDGATTAY